MRLYVQVSVFLDHHSYSNSTHENPNAESSVLCKHILQVVEFILPTFSWGNRMNSTSVAYHNPISVNLIVLIND